ncbi:glycosyltransferase family 4 protein [Mannheimia indoligenes]|uniref:glycosyltransferase family 4 protein n=1 Tax=Mannheimia indoligenes TaxID=3103145 RepID=UPI002FE6187A
MILNFRKELVLELVKQGHQVYCLAYDYSEEQKAEVRKWGAIPYDHFINPKGLNIIKDIKASYQLYADLKQIQPDVVFNTFIKPVIFGGLTAKLAKVPRVIGMIEGLGNGFTAYKEGFSRKAKIIRYAQVILYRLSLPYLDKVIFLNPDDKRDLLDRYRIPVKAVDVLGGIGVDLKKFPFSEAPINPVSFIFIARLLREKGTFEYLAAAEEVKKIYPQTKFIILGGFDTNNPFGLSSDTLQNYIEQGIIEYHGYVDNVPEMIANSSVFVLPSYREGVPRSTQEAMAIGRAVITTDVPGCRETVKDGVNGFLISPYSHQHLAEKMIYFIENPQAISQMGLESRKWAERHFDIKEVNNRLISIILPK